MAVIVPSSSSPTLSGALAPTLTPRYALLTLYKRAHRITSSTSPWRPSPALLLEDVLSSRLAPLPPLSLQGLACLWGRAGRCCLTLEDNEGSRSLSLTVYVLSTLATLQGSYSSFKCTNGKTPMTTMDLQMRKTMMLTFTASRIDL